MKAFHAWIAIGAALVGCSGSGSSSSAPSCGPVAPCGGDIRGTWRVVGTCTSSPPSSTSYVVCPNQGVEKDSVNSIVGTAIFSSNMTYRIHVIESVSETLVIPVSCLKTPRLTVTCDELETAVNGASDDDAGRTTSTCTTSGSSCDCDITVNGADTVEVGKYALSGDTLSTRSGASAVSEGYCVQGNTLRVIPSSTDFGVGNATALSVTGFVATRE